MGKTIDLTGQRFGKLLVIKRVDNYISPSGGQKARWECKCDCGNVVYSTTSNIKSGKQQCWDCAHKATGIAKRKDIIGKKYGYLTVLSVRRDDDKSGKQRAYCLCECDCGNKTEILMDVLLSKGLHSCGCARKEIADQLSTNIIGFKYGRLTVIEEYKEYTPRKVKCLCECGKEIVIVKSQLCNNHTQSCGCLQKERVSQTNEKDWTNYVSEYNITLINQYKKNKNGTWIWNCKCHCGKIFQELPAYIVSGHIKSCGCVRLSSGEQVIKKYLDDNNINYVSQYSFDDCRDIMPLPFDFALLNEYNLPYYLIEYDGAQHYTSIEWFGGEEGFLTRKVHDYMKDQYCEDHNLKIMRFSYLQKDNEIKQILANIIQP